MLHSEMMRGKPAIKAEFHLSLAIDLFDVMSIIKDSPHVEGLDQWVYASQAAFPESLKNELDIFYPLFIKTGAFSLRILRLSFDHPVHQQYTALLAWLDSLTADDIVQMIKPGLTLMLNKHLKQEDKVEIDLENVDQLRKALEWLPSDQLDRAIHLIHHPLEIKAMSVSLIQRFWDQYYRDEYERNLPLMQRSIAYHRSKEYGADLVSIFTSVTGRRPPEKLTSIEDVERLVFLPSCHIGPYVLQHRLEEMPTTSFLIYNCRPTAAPDGGEASPIQDLFPPLKALADETRLQILSILDDRELYAQEIVDQLDISQSAVSRHLKLMFTGGLLNMRKQESMRYYSINNERLAALAERLKSFRSKPES